MRMVIDTSVFVSAVRSSEGRSREVIRRCLQQQFQPLMGQALFLEYEDVLSRQELWASAPVSEAERAELFHAFMSVSTWTRVFYLWRPNLSDEADNHVVELAVAGGAETIVTFNERHLTSGELKFPGLRIQTPAEILAEG